MARDDELVEECRSRIQATGLFGIVFASRPNTGDNTNSQRAIAWVDRLGWTEQDRSEESKIRTVRLSVFIEVSDQDPMLAFRRLCTLEAAVQNALSGVSLGGAVVPQMTKFGSGRDLNVVPPNRVVEMSGEIVYIVAGFQAHSASDRT